MDRMKPAILGFLLICVFTQLGYPAEKLDLQDRSLTLLVNSSYKTKPDLAIVKLDFASFGWTVEKARKNTNQTVQKFLDKLKKQNIQPSQIIIGDAKLKPSYQFNRDLKANVPS